MANSRHTRITVNAVVAANSAVDKNKINDKTKRQNNFYKFSFDGG
jgi:hypothetical protein